MTAHCERCGRAETRKRIVATRVGNLCQVCAEHLSKALRRPTKENRRVP